MKKTTLIALILCFTQQVGAQVVSVSSNIVATPPTDNTVPFQWDAEGQYMPIEWGLDLAWLDEGNLRRGLLFAGTDLIDVIRASFRPSESNMSGELSTSQRTYLNRRVNLIKTYCKDNVLVNINDDHGEVGDMYQCANTTTTEKNRCAAEWAKCIDVHRLAYQAEGINVESVSPVNETDYDYHGQISTNESLRKDIFTRICRLLTGSDYDYNTLGIHLVGGNTLNNDKALNYWNTFRTYLGEGNTHQLAGGFDTYAAFFPAVVARGQKSTNDELHNVMECMVGAEYNMQRGIWWGTCEHTRSQFMKASNNGVRLAYSENRPKWTAASVYRHNDGTVEGFTGASERQATTTTFRFVATDKDVWYDGHGPMREYVLKVEADASGAYGSDDQLSREELVNIQTGEDIQPVINGSYKIANRANVTLSITSSGTLGAYASAAKWSVTPHERTWRGDISYHVIKLDNGASKAMYLDVLNWGLTKGTAVTPYAGGFGTNEQWYLRYAGDGSFYIMSRHNAMCLQPKNGSATSGASLEVAPVTGANSQKWRFLATDLSSVPSTSPQQASEFEVTGQPCSVKLKWNFPYNSRTKTYTTANYSFNVLRRVKGETEWQLLASGLLGTSFTDNTAVPGVQYEYSIRTRFTHNLNRGSQPLAAQEASVTDEKALLGWWCTGDSLQDASVNGNHSAIYGAATYADGKVENTKAISLSGKKFLQLPSTIASRSAFSFAAWVYWNDDSNWQRIFDFGNGESQYMFLTPSNGSQMRFVLKNNGDEQILSTSSLAKKSWVHLVATVDENGAALYVNGTKVAEKAVGIVPSDFNPMFNYIGRSQYAADPYFNGYINDARAYNYALSPDDVSKLYNGEEPTGITSFAAMEPQASETSSAPSYDLSGRRVNPKQKGFVITNGSKYYNNR